MNTIISLGRYLFVLPLLVFGLGHFGSANQMAEMAPFGGVAVIYFTGAALIAAAISIIIRKYDKLAAVLLALMLILFALTLHLPGMMGATDEMAKQAFMGNMLKDIGLAGGALMYASMARDPSVVG